MKIFNLVFVLIISICSTIIAQTNYLKINQDIVMPEDSIAGKAILLSVNAFLSSAHQDGENEWVLGNENVATQLLIDEILDIEKSEAFENDAFYKPYLTKITPLENQEYAVHIAYIGINNQSAMLRANFELIAHKSNDIYLFSSPLKRNTHNWKTETVENHVFHYPHTLDSEKIQEYYEFASFYDKKLKNDDGETHYYLCENEVDPLKLFGVEYKSDYNGWKLDESSWVSSIGKKSVFVLNASDFYDFDTHDLWHNRLSQVISRKKVNRNVDCNIACLYGGCWGKSWEELFPMFSEKFVVGNNVDWLEHWRNKSHFKTNQGRNKNYTNDFVGALIVKKVEKEKGWDGVWELLMTNGFEEYWASLENLVGISKKNYNTEAFKLIEEEMNDIGLKINGI